MGALCPKRAAHSPKYVAHNRWCSDSDDDASERRSVNNAISSEPPSELSNDYVVKLYTWVTDPSPEFRIVSRCRRDLPCFFRDLQTDKRITRLELAWVPLACDTMQSMCEAFKMNRTITELDLTGSKPYSSGWDHGITALVGSPSLTTLVLAHQRFSKQAIQCIERALAANTVLRTLNVRNCDIGTNACVFGHVLRVNTVLTSLNIASNFILSDILCHIALPLSFQTNATLTSLNIHSNNITADSMRSLRRALMTNTTLTTLVLHETDDTVLYDNAGYTRAVMAYVAANKQAMQQRRELRRCHVRACRTGAEVEPLCALPPELIDVIARWVRRSVDPVPCDNAQ